MKVNSDNVDTVELARLYIESWDTKQLDDYAVSCMAVELQENKEMRDQLYEQYKECFNDSNE